MDQNNEQALGQMLIEAMQREATVRAALLAAQNRITALEGELKTAQDHKGV